jgi:hypothetical protein
VESLSASPAQDAIDININLDINIVCGVTTASQGLRCRHYALAAAHRRE